MDTLLDDVVIQVRRCEGAAQRLLGGPIKKRVDRLQDVINDVSASHSGSWLGYHADCYYREFEAPPPEELFSRMSGPPTGNWFAIGAKEMRTEILKRANVNEADLVELHRASREVRDIADRCKDELLASLDAVLADRADAALTGIREEIATCSNYVDQGMGVAALQPRGSIITHDMEAVGQGNRVPGHLVVQIWIVEKMSAGRQAEALAKAGRRAQLYLEKRLKLKGTSVAKTTGKIFIGHGGDPAWKDLKDFLQDRLKLEWSEFNREPPAGKTTTQRLQEMLDESSFAFLVMTAEDQRADETMHARENVVHEVGLFQGRLGFDRAIVMLENGCKEFSNIEGLGQIRFPKGKIKSEFEEVRRVLERAGILKV